MAKVRPAEDYQYKILGGKGSQAHDSPPFRTVLPILAFLLTQRRIVPSGSGDWHRGCFSWHILHMNRVSDSWHLKCSHQVRCTMLKQPLPVQKALGLVVNCKPLGLCE